MFFKSKQLCKRYVINKRTIVGNLDGMCDDIGLLVLLFSRLDFCFSLIDSRIEVSRFFTSKKASPFSSYRNVTAIFFLLFKKIIILFFFFWYCNFLKKKNQRALSTKIIRRNVVLTQYARAAATAACQHYNSHHCYQRYGEWLSSLFSILLFCFVSSTLNFLFIRFLDIAASSDCIPLILILRGWLASIIIFHSNFS